MLSSISMMLYCHSVDDDFHYSHRNPFDTPAVSMWIHLDYHCQIRIVCKRHDARIDNNKNDFYGRKSSYTNNKHVERTSSVLRSARSVVLFFKLDRIERIESNEYERSMSTYQRSTKSQNSAEK
jgi:hypothetical protein